MKTTRTLGVALLSMFVATACDNTSPGDPLDPVLDEVAAAVAADAALEDLAQMGFAFSTPYVMSADGGVPSTISRVVTWFDAAGTEQTAFDPVTTASIRIQVEISNAAARGDWSATVQRMRDMTVSGLEGQETSRIWNGTGSATVSRARSTDAHGDQTFDMSSTSTITDVVRGLPRDQNPWPLSGTISRTLTITIVNGPDGDQTRTRVVTVVFNGTQFVTMTVNGEEYELDLGARDGTRPHRQRNGATDGS